MQIHLLITPTTLIIGGILSTFASGPGLLAYDINEAWNGHRPASRIAKIAADIFILAGFVTTGVGYKRADELMMKKGLILWGSSLIVRFALTVFSKIRGEHTNL